MEGVEEVIRSLGRQVSDGSYFVDTRAVAAALLRRRPDVAALAAQEIATHRARVERAPGQGEAERRRAPVGGAPTLSPPEASQTLI